MKKFFEKHDLVKISLIMILITVLLSWVVKQGYFNAGQLVEGEITRVGLFDMVTYGFLGMYYFTVLVSFLFVLGAFYQFLSKLGAYQKLTDKIANKVKGKEIIFSLIISFIFAGLASIINEYLVLVAFMPFIITICSKLNMDKISSFVTTFGAMLVGILGSTISQKVAGMNVQYLGVQYTDNLLEKILLFAVAFIIYSLFNVIYIKRNFATKSNAKKDAKVKVEKKTNKKDKIEIESVYKLIILLNVIAILILIVIVLNNDLVNLIYTIFNLVASILLIVCGAFIFKKAKKAVWKLFIPIYNILVMLEIAGLKWYYVILYFIPIVNIYVLCKMYINTAKRFNKSTVFAVGMILASYIFIPILAFDKSKYNANNNKVENASKKEVVESRVCEDLFAASVKYSDKSNTIPLIIVGVLAIITIILAYLPWVNVFKVDWFTKAYTAVTEAQVFGQPIFKYILGNVTEFGSWDLFGVQVVMILSMLVLAICYRKGLTDIIDSFCDGFKKSGKLVVVLLLSYVILEFAVMYPVIPTILGKVLGSKFNVLTTALGGFITSLFTSEYQYTINLIYSYVTAAYQSNIHVVSIILQSIYGLVSFFVPSSAMLLVGLSYLEIPYKDWMKYIWKFLVAMLVVIIVMAFIIV